MPKYKYENKEKREKKDEIEKTATIESPKIQVDANGRPLFFPHRFPTRHCPYNGFSAPRSSVNIVHSIRSSLFQIRGGVARATYRFRGMQRLALEGTYDQEKEQTRKKKVGKEGEVRARQR